MDIQAWISQLGHWFLTSGLRVALILILMLVALKLTPTIAERLLASAQRGKDDDEAKKRRETLSSVARYALNVTIAIVVILMIMGEVGIEVGPVLAAAGIVGLAVGFGAQSLVKDVISGFFILLENQMRVGDVVQIGGEGGLVERISLRTTVLRDLAGNVHYVPNGEIKVVTNMTKEFSRYVFDIGVAYREDVDEVIEIIKQLDEELRKDPDFADDILEPLEVLGVDQFADSAVIIKARTTTKPIKQWRVAREFNRRMKRRFDERNIEIPFPHVTVYMGEDKKGRSPVVNVAMQANGGSTA